MYTISTTRNLCSARPKRLFCDLAQYHRSSSQSNIAIKLMPHFLFKKITGIVSDGFGFLKSGLVGFGFLVFRVFK